MEYQYQIQKDLRDLRVFRNCLVGQLTELALTLWCNKTENIKNRDRKKLEDEIQKIKALYEDISVVIFALENHHRDSHLIFEKTEMEAKIEYERRQRYFDQWLTEQTGPLPQNYANLINSLFNEIHSINENLVKIVSKKCTR
ncbi:MAG: hypothetical protein EBZ69_03705 [Alphaproteobacteria bacterium]|nr:hypothetical protein [Alphaproteobacteria bacterium]NDC55905.1 hypothetical protein [Alphaproteobacteria bacterium]NDG26934.1 hypothetical protein [Pseudomonadota bacterium]